MESSRPNLHLWDIECIVLRVLQLRATAELVLNDLELESSPNCSCALQPRCKLLRQSLGQDCHTVAFAHHDHTSANISTMYPTRHRWGTRVIGSAATRAPHLGQRVNETLLVCTTLRHTVALGHCIHVFAVHGHSLGCIVPNSPNLR